MLACDIPQKPSTRSEKAIRHLCYRLVCMKIGLALVLVAATGVTEGFSPTGGQEAENATVKYLRADAALRQSYALPPDAATQLLKALDSPLNGEDEKLVAAATEALVEFHHGAGLKRCDWTMSIEDGPLANTAHRGAVKELVAVAGLRARLRFRDGDTDGAVSDALAAMAAARHLSGDGSLASVLFAYGLEDAVTRVLAQNLYRLSAGELNRLASGLDALPSGLSLAIAFKSEKVDRNDLFLRLADGATSRDDLVARLLKKVPILESDRARASKIVDGCGSCVSGFRTCAQQQQSFYASWSSRFTMPPKQFESTYKSEMEGIAGANPLIRLFTPNLPRFRWADSYKETRRALLKAAIAVRLDGPSAVNQHPDPSDGNPFSYIPVGGGFQLESRQNEAGSPLALSIPTSPAGDSGSPEQSVPTPNMD